MESNESNIILAYLPSFIKNIVLESESILFSSISDIPFKTYLLNSNNKILTTIKAKHIGENNLWQCKIPQNIFRNIHKVIIT